MEGRTSEPIIDIETVQTLIPPIEGTFDPELELQKLWDTPRELRPENKSIFKDKLNRQIEAWSFCQQTIENSVMENFDLPLSRMEETIDIFSMNYGFPERRVDIAKQLCSDYIETRLRIKEIKEEYGDDKIGLIARITGNEKEELVELGNIFELQDVQVKEGPAWFEIYSDNENLRSYLFGNYQLSSEVDAFASYSYYPYIFINTDIMGYRPHMTSFATNISNKKLVQEAVIHEQQHLKNALLQKRIENDRDINERKNNINDYQNLLKGKFLKVFFSFRSEINKEEFSLMSDYKLSNDPQKKVEVLEDLFRIERARALKNAKDELLAVKSNSKSPENRIFFSCTDYKIFEPGRIPSPYDYLKDLRNIEGRDEIWDEMTQKVLVNEYMDIIKSADIAYELLHFSEKKYSNKHMLNMLTYKPLEEWPKFVFRLLDDDLPYAKEKMKYRLTDDTTKEELDRIFPDKLSAYMNS